MYYTCRVDKERVGRKGDGQFSSLASSQLGPVAEGGTVADKVGAVYHVVFEDFRELRHRHVGKRRAELLEGIVVGSEYGQIFRGVEIGIKGSFSHGATDPSEVELGAGGDKVRWGNQEVVDCLHNAVFELKVLVRVSLRLLK